MRIDQAGRPAERCVFGAPNNRVSVMVTTAAPRIEPAATDTPARRRLRLAAKGAGLVVAVTLLGVAVLASIGVGAKPIPLSRVLDALIHYDRTDTDHLIVRTIRVPRTAVGLVVGVALGLAGTLMQGLTRNPLADPGILGVNAGAALFVAMGIYTFGVTSSTTTVWFAMAGAALASVLVYALGSIGRDGATPVKLALAGAAVSILCMSLTRAVLLIDLATLDQFRFWDVGSLSGRPGTVVWSVLPFVATGSVLALALTRSLNGLALGDDTARALGQRVRVVRGVGALGIVLLCGAATAAAGPIGFVGLTVPHVARAVVGPDYRWVAPYSAVLAPLLLLGSDVLGRVIARPGEVEVGIVTAAIGAPVFIALVRRRKLAQL